jgi:hypothetical protein
MRPIEILQQMQKDDAEAAALAASIAVMQAEKPKVKPKAKVTKGKVEEKKALVVAPKSQNKYAPVMCGPNGFQMEDVVQGSIGTCYLMSAVGVAALREVNSSASQCPK